MSISYKDGQKVWRPGDGTWGREQSKADLKIIVNFHFKSFVSRNWIFSEEMSLKFRAFETVFYMGLVLDLAWGYWHLWDHLGRNCRRTSASDHFSARRSSIGSIVGELDQQIWIYMTVVHSTARSFITIFLLSSHFRYNYSQKKFLYSQLQPAMRKQAIYEGTKIEEEAIKRAEEA